MNFIISFILILKYRKSPFYEFSEIGKNKVADLLWSDFSLLYVYIELE